jgi:citrate lyase subunit beta/citryl-CoA lyase
MRSLLFVPAHDERKLAKGLACGADALIVDLEDAVPETQKERAREMCAAFVREHRERVRLFVRINALGTEHLEEDLRAVILARPYGVMLPKCEGGADVATLSAQIEALERQHDMAPGATRIMPIATETAAGVLAMGTYSAPAEARLCGLMWGGEDLAADIGALSNKDGQGRYTAPYELARTLTLLGATAAQVAPVDAVFTNFRDLDGLRAEATQALRDGFTAKAAIHPDQVAIINDAFTPSDAEVQWARKVLAAFDANPRSGAIGLEGKMLDRPHQRSAQRVLARAATRPD